MNMGIGDLGNPSIIFKRKFRYTLEIFTPRGIVPAYFVKVASRPNLQIEETEVNFLNATTWIPGKGKWQPLNVTYYDVSDGYMQSLYDWIATVHDFMDPVKLLNSEKAGWNSNAILNMYDGCGQVLESWYLGSVWPQNIDFGEVDYGNSDIAEINLTLRFSEVRFESACGMRRPNAICAGC